MLHVFLATLKKARYAVPIVFTVLAFGAVRTDYPSPEDPGPPFYARIELGLVIQDGTTAAIPFYRDPAGVPADFNLLNLFDVPRAFSCALTVAGFDLWKNGPPPVDMAPIQSETRGLGAVPVWFVDWTELRAVMSDHQLTITELSALPSLQVGFASFYQETLHPAGGAQVDTKDIVARGALEDGTAFQLHVTAGPGGSNVNISFR